MNAVVISRSHSPFFAISTAAVAVVAVGIRSAASLVASLSSSGEPQAELWLTTADGVRRQETTKRNTHQIRSDVRAVAWRT